MSPFRFEHAGLTVSDLDRMLPFFTGVLGFELKARLKPFDPFAVPGITGVADAVVAEIAYLARNDFTLEVLQYREPPPRVSPLRPCDPGYFHWLVTVDDLPTAMAEVATFGFAPVTDPYCIRVGPNTGRLGTYLRHPDGFSLEIIGGPGV